MKRSSAIGPTRQPAAARPTGARPPHPDLPLLIARCAVLLCVAAFIARPALLDWAGTLSTQPAPAMAGLPSPGELGITVLRVALDKPVAAWLRLVGLLGLTAMLGEGLLALLLMVIQARATRHTARVYLRVRAPAPLAGLSGGAGTSPSGDQLFRAIQQAIPCGFWARLLGHAPWVAFTLSGRPDQPVELGLVLADRHGRRRTDLASAIRVVIQGQSPGTQVEERPDPLAEALGNGATLAWREFGLRLPAHFPLRSLDDIEGSDLLGPLAAALAPRGTLHVEAQLILRPARVFALNRGWRGHATRLLLQLQAKEDYALSPDARALDARLDATPYEATVRVVVVASGEHAAALQRAALEQIGAVLGQYAQRTSHHLQQLTPIGGGRVRSDRDGRMATLMARAPRFAPPPPFLLPARPWRDPTILTSIEIAGLWHLPAPALGQLVAWLPCRFLPAPPHAFTRGHPKRIVMGLATRADGSVAPVGPTLFDMRYVVHLTAGMGAGKSRLLANLCHQLIGRGFILLDGKGDDRAGNLAATVRQLIPLEAESRLAILDILDAEWPIGLNPLAGIDMSRPGAIDLALGQLMAIFARLDPETWSAAPGMQQYIRNAALLVIEGERYPTIAHVKRALLDGAYRARLLTHCTNIEVRSFWEVIEPRTSENQKSSRDALLRRFDALLTTETTRYLMTQPLPTLDLLAAIEEGLIVLAPIPDLTLGDLAGAIGMLVFQAVVRAAAAREGDDQSRSTYPLIVDELQVFIGAGDTRDVRKAITQLRSLGIAGVYAHQSLTQLGDLMDEMLINSSNRIILKTQEPDASIYASRFPAGIPSAADISNQDPDGHQYAALTCDRMATGAFSMQPSPWPAPVPIELPAHDGPDWRQSIPDDSPDPQFDRRVLALIYGDHAEPAALAQRLARCSDEHWEQLQRRWNAIRQHQRATILAHPGSIPDRLERQRWLSRLLVARPRVLAAAEYARMRHEPG